IRWSIANTDALTGGHCRGHLLHIVIWDVCHGILSRPVYCPILAELLVPSLWLGLDDRPPHYYELFVAHRGNHSEALFTVLCVPRLSSLHSTMAPLGGCHPPSSPLCPRERGPCGHF